MHYFEILSTDVHEEPKTKYIRDLIKLERVFISRPRRFGKSLTLDTIASLFETGVEPYFKGT